MTPDEFDRQLQAIFRQTWATRRKELFVVIALAVLIGLVPFLR